MTSSLTWILTGFVILFSISSIAADAAADAKCEDVQVQTCDDCIRAHPNCAWCLEGKFNGTFKRCRSLEKQRGVCENLKMENPRSTVEATQDDEFSVIGKVSPGDKVVQLKPQRIHLDLRKGEPKKFNITYRKVSDYPVDLYYVMDLSNSMNNDLATLQNLGASLASNIQSNVTQDIQLGFGTFVDKVMMPFASTVPDQLRNPCFKNKNSEECAPPFGFKHQQKISPKLDEFRKAVRATTISGNIDSPEGGFDALMQIAVCTDAIGWRNESTHLVVFTTDASFHMALDGKLAAILEMNDLGCHLEKGANTYLPDDVVYSKSKEQDYPSIGQLRHVFSKFKIQPIFAVTKEVKPLYDGLRELIPNSHVDELAKDSSNIIGIIKDAYNKLKGKLEMTLDKSAVEKYIDVKYRVLCPPGKGGWKDQELGCDNITIGSQVVYEFEMTAKDCPGDDIELPPIGFTSSSLQETVFITFGFKCSCDCTALPEDKSPSCNTNGSLVCGKCACDSQHEGAKCQCVREEDNVELVGKCKKDGPNDDICEGNGQCSCGECECNDDYFDTHCQCSNKGCPKDENTKVCGGPDQGECRNCNNDGRCQCINGWTHDLKLHTCTCHDNLCKNMTNNDTEVCSGHGKCNCKRCECNGTGIWSGKYCDKCIHPSCKEEEGSKCSKKNYQNCATCLNEAERDTDLTCTAECEGIEYEKVTTLPNCNECGGDDDCTRVCKKIDLNIAPPDAKPCTSPITNSECDIKYQVVWFTKKQDYGLLVKKYNMKEDCREAPNPLYIVLPIVAGIVLLGLIALAVWKIYQTIRDKKEWENFEKEMKQSRWTKGQNPIFQKPFTKFQNPTYQGH